MSARPWATLFICYLFSRGISSAGASLVAVVLGFAVLSAGGGAFAVGLVLALSFTAHVFFLPITGVLADRLSRKFLAICANLTLAITQLSLGTAIFVGAESIWMFAIAALAAGAAGAAARPAYEGILVDLVPTESLQRANVALRLVLNISRVTVPALGAILGATLGFGQILACAGIAFLLSATAFLVLPTTGRPKTTNLWADARAGWSAFTQRRWLCAFVLRGTIAVPFWLAGYQLLGPVVLAVRPAGLQVWGWAVSALTAGLITGSLVAVWWRPRRLVLAASCVSLAWPTPLAALALEVQTAWLLTTMFLCGIALDISNVLFHTAKQQHVPKALIGKVSALTYIGESALVPFGYLLGGVVAASLGATAVLWVCLAVILSSTAVLLMVDEIRKVERVVPMESESSVRA